MKLKMLTFSSFFLQASSLCDMSSIQCDRVAIIPAVVALNVKDSPLKSTEWAPCCCSMDAVTQVEDNERQKVTDERKSFIKLHCTILYYNLLFT